MISKKGNEKLAEMLKSARNENDIIRYLFLWLESEKGFDAEYLKRYLINRNPIIWEVIRRLTELEV
jgi:hypothetical protein